MNNTSRSPKKVQSSFAKAAISGITKQFQFDFINIIALFLVVHFALSMARHLSAPSAPLMNLETLLSFLIFLCGIGLFLRQEWARVTTCCLMSFSLYPKVDPILSTIDGVRSFSANSDISELYYMALYPQVIFFTVQLVAIIILLSKGSLRKKAADKNV